MNRFRAERDTALRKALLDLPRAAIGYSPCSSKISPQSYAQISATLGIPIGNIGPSRGRCLDKLRHHPAIAALINPETPRRDELNGQATVSGCAVVSRSRPSGCWLAGSAG